MQLLLGADRRYIRFERLEHGIRWPGLTTDFHDYLDHLPRPYLLPRVRLPKRLCRFPRGYRGSVALRFAIHETMFDTVS